MEMAVVFATIAEIWQVFLSHPKVYFAIVGEWLLTIIYAMITGSDESHADVYATGVTLGFVGFELYPIEEGGFSFGNPVAIISIIMMIYGACLLIMGATKVMPAILTNIFGSAGMISIPTLLALLYYHGDMELSQTVILIICIPVISLEVIKELRQHVLPKNE